MRPFFLSLAAAVLIVPLLLLALRRRGGRPTRSQGVAVAAGITYGVVGRILFGLSYSKWDKDLPQWFVTSFAVMSLSFLLLMPLVVGFLDQVVLDPGRPRWRYPWVQAFFAPMMPVLMMLSLMIALSLEGTICIVMALPIFLVLAGIGGLLGFLVRRDAEPRTRTGVISLLLFLPYVASPVEQRVEAPVEVRGVRNTIRIRADADTVWREIKSVRAIAPRELPFSLSHLIGLPRPIEATLSDDREGGVRIATFERGLSFRETVTRWEPGRALSFSIRAEPAPKAALDEHVAVGGPYFDVLDGTYVLEAAPDGTTLLELTSHQRLSTRFNFYARLWTDFVMSDLQSAIMEVIRKRSEAALRDPRSNGPVF